MFFTILSMGIQNVKLLSITEPLWKTNLKQWTMTRGNLKTDKVRKGSPMLMFNFFGPEKGVALLKWTKIILFCKTFQHNQSGDEPLPSPSRSTNDVTEMPICNPLTLYEILGNLGDDLPFLSIEVKLTYFYPLHDSCRCIFFLVSLKWHLTRQHGILK